MGKIRILLAVSILLVSGQVGAGIISDLTPMEGAELWKYSVQGSAGNDKGNFVDISGSMLIDTTVRGWTSPYSPRPEPCNCSNFFHVLAFGLRIGDLSFFGGGPFSNPGNDHALYFTTR